MDQATDISNMNKEQLAYLLLLYRRQLESTQANMALIENRIIELEAQEEVEKTKKTSKKKRKEIIPPEPNETEQHNL